MTPTIPNGEAPRNTHAATAEAPHQLRARTPQESLGLAVESGLLRACIQAGVVTVVLLAALTVGPYLWDRQFPPAAKSGPPAKAETATTPEPPTAPDPTPKKSPTPPAEASKSPNKSEIVGKLGENVAKPASPSVNPLDKKDDDILKEIK